MKCPNIIQFFIQTAEEGGYIAQAVGFSIYTQGDTLDETVRNIKEATDCHFGKNEAENCFFN
ncbi:MAG: 2-oxoisovalerate dehydrogenase [Candidatus Terrybacteria bacterium CG10_big_fil_rev_8_21_14_0_10_41_10]|uniref:2-oxoisovalerate dehydrogenase n=1 Tax=Candidatus Terrybacteria bacterium CG10_big_fil_rev_8_21_14_0_10_41_10 TaxID=1975026 RepID=A0A2M8L9V6_9BACT|nr:MAG: 2-oxoisovalerate dehydrogenase [Candidatus Terrybacteria bacterium CG10_big_fil_rev_8_21_14_0_10_41_10]